MRPPSCRGAISRIGANPKTAQKPLFYRHSRGLPETRLATAIDRVLHRCARLG